MCNAMYTFTMVEVGPSMINVFRALDTVTFRGYSQYPNFRANDYAMCKKNKDNASALFPYVHPPHAFSLAVELTPLETLSRDISSFALDSWSLRLYLETITSAPFCAPTSGQG